MDFVYKDIKRSGSNLLKLGFQPLEENSSGDMTYSPYEGWVPEAFGSISHAAEQGDEWLYEQVPPYYRQLMAEMDKDGDGKVTEEEIRQALVVRDPLVRNVVNHLTVKHHSEWYGGRSTGRWEEFYKGLDTEEVAYCEKWQTDMEWMREVSPFSCNNPVWHFHPVVFLDAIKFSALSLEEARVRAFMRMIRVCEGTTGEDGYEKLFGGESFIKDYHRTFSTHPQIKIKRTNKKSGKTYISSAAGAYQVMGYTWDDPSTIDWRKKYDILNFSPSSQDLLCVAILKEKVRNDALNMIVHGKIKEAIEDSCSYEWACLPHGRYGQPIKSISECLDIYDDFFDKELNWNTDLHISYSFLKDFPYEYICIFINVHFPYICVWGVWNVWLLVCKMWRFWRKHRDQFG